MTGTDRVGYAVAVNGHLAFGDPAHRHVIVDSDSLRYLDSRVDHDGPGQWTGPIPWAHVNAVEVEAPTTTHRYPGGTATAFASVLGLIGLEWFPSTADFSVTVRTPDDEVFIVCDGFVGRGYRANEARTLDALVNVLVHRPQTRPALGNPLAVVHTLAAVAEEQTLDDASRRDHLADRLGALAS